MKQAVAMLGGVRVVLAGQELICDSYHPNSAISLPRSTSCLLLFAGGRNRKDTPDG